MNQRVRTGFTLIEVLVALAVFGVMSMLAYSALSFDTGECRLPW